MATKAVFLDALGTLVELEPPWRRLACALPDADSGRVEDAMRKEMAYYREHAHEGTDSEALAELRRRCAELLSRELGEEVGVETMMSAIRFHPPADARPALTRLRELGLMLVCVSNWDVSLPDVLERAGLGGLLDGVISSAAAGARKPDPAIFRAALELAGCEPDEALHVGDTPEEDIAGAQAAGIPALLLDRAGTNKAAQQRRGSATPHIDIASLAEIEEHLRA
jgi:putative hydrolase of the HAD superfamily